MRKCILMNKYDDVPNRASVLLNSTVDTGICPSEVDDIVIKSGQKHPRPSPSMASACSSFENSPMARYRPRGVRMN